MLCAVRSGVIVSLYMLEAVASACRMSLHSILRNDGLPFQRVSLSGAPSCLSRTTLVWMFFAISFKAGT